MQLCIVVYHGVVVSCAGCMLISTGGLDWYPVLLMHMVDAA